MSDNNLVIQTMFRVILFRWWARHLPNTSRQFQNSFPSTFWEQVQYFRNFFWTKLGCLCVQHHFLNSRIFRVHRPKKFHIFSVSTVWNTGTTKQSVCINVMITSLMSRLYKNTKICYSVLFR